MRHLLNPLDFSVGEIEQLLDLASDIEKNPDRYAHVCDGKKIATLFYEPALLQRAKVFLIQFVLFPVLQIYVPCVTQKKAHRW